MSLALASSGISDHQLSTLRSSGVPVILTSGNLQASFEGASRTRRMGSWGVSNSGPNASISGNLSTLRNRSHEFLRNHPLAQNAIDTFVSNMIGTGIVPRFKIEDKALRERLQKRWLRWTDQSDADGLSDFYGMQAMAARTIMESGEVLCRRRIRRKGDGLPVPLQLQLMEPDHLPHELNQKTDSGDEIQMGVEFDWLGKRTAYHVTRRHPGDAFFDANKVGTTRISANDMLHCFRPLRPGQIRGLPWLTTVMVRLHELDQYTDAELVRKKTAAMFSAFVTSPAGDGNPLGGLGMGEDAAGRGITGLEPGTVQFLEPGEEVEFSAPADVGQNTMAWMQQQLREVAVGIGVTYEQLTGDLSNVNFSSLRAGLVEFRRRCEMLQFSMMVYQFCRPILRWWMDMLDLSGLEDLPGYAERKDEYLDVEWRTPRWAYVNPVDDILAEQMAVRNGFKARSQVIAEQGYDAEEVDRQIKEDNDRADGSGLIFDTDPRQTAKSGAVQKAESTVLSGVGGSRDD